MKSKPMQCIYCCQKVNSSTGYSFDNAKWIHNDCEKKIEVLKDIEHNFANNYQDKEVRQCVFDDYRDMKNVYNACIEFDKESNCTQENESSLSNFIKFEESLISSYEKKLSETTCDLIPITDEMKERHILKLERFKYVVGEYKNGVDVLEFIIKNQKIFFGQ